MATGKQSFTGVVPASILPFDRDLAIDEVSLRRHLNDLGSVAGVTGVVVNGHAGEVSSCSLAEQQRIVEIAAEEIGDRVDVISGVFAQGSRDAGQIARMMTKAGASALLVFPSIMFADGQKPDMVITHYKHVADASDLPLMIFQFGERSEQNYSLDMLLKLIEAIPSIRALKDGSTNPRMHEAQIRALQGAPRNINILATQATWLLSALAMGSRGILSGSGSVLASLHADLFAAVQKKDMNAAEAARERIYRIARFFYADPVVDQHNRMKEALVLLGKLPRAVVRPPLTKLTAAEVEGIRSGLVGAGLLSGAEVAAKTAGGSGRKREAERLAT